MKIITRGFGTSQLIITRGFLLGQPIFRGNISEMIYSASLEKPSIYRARYLIEIG